jgi:hypothetical protein
VSGRSRSGRRPSESANDGSRRRVRRCDVLYLPLGVSARAVCTARPALYLYIALLLHVFSSSAAALNPLLALPPTSLPVRFKCASRMPARSLCSLVRCRLLCIAEREDAVRSRPSSAHSVPMTDENAGAGSNGLKRPRVGTADAVSVATSAASAPPPPSIGLCSVPPAMFAPRAAPRMPWL